MSQIGVNIDKGKMGPNIAGKPFRQSSLVTTGVAVVGKLTLGTVYRLVSVEDCKDLGLNADYDQTNNVVVFEHISEFYRQPKNEGVPLFLQVNSQATTLATMIDDVTFQYCKKVIIEAKGEVHNMAIGFNPDDDYTETLVDGINSEVRAAIVKAQGLAEWAYQTFRPINILLECRGMGTSATTALNLRAVPATPSGIFEADMVSLVAGQDYGFADSLDGLAKKHAAIGTALGVLASCEVNQNIAEVEPFNLTDEIRGKWLVAGLSNHVTVTDQESSLGTFTQKGYIFADTYVGISGYRWNDDPTCTPIKIDADGNMNTHTIGYGRTMNFVSRRMRAKLLPFVKKVKPVDPRSGKMTVGTRKELESAGNDAIEEMASKGWLSGGSTSVDPDSDILVEKTVEFGYNIVPYGTLKQLNGSANLKIRN